MKNNKPQIEVAGYVRTATIPQIKDGVSAETQEKQIKKYCKAIGYKLTKIFSDNGCSGANLERPGLQALLAEASSGKMSKVICLDLSRLSRRTIDYLVLKSLLKKNGVEVITITRANTSDDSISQTMEEMMAVINSFQPRLRECNKGRGHKGK